jgi:glucose/arabinose dehydrogenase
MKRLTLVGIGLILTANLVVAQDATPSPAPTKTTTPQPTLEQAAVTASESTVKFEPLTQADLTVITGNVQRPNGMVWFDEKLFVVCNGDWTVYEIDANNGDTRTYIYGVRNGHALHAEQNNAGQLVLWVPDFDQNMLLEVNPVRAARPVATGLDSPWGIAYLNENEFLISNLGADTVVRVNRSGMVSPMIEGLRRPTGVAVDGDFVYIANNGSARRAIEWVDMNTPNSINPLVSGLQSTTGLTLGPDGYLYFAYSLGSRGIVGRVDPVACREGGGCGNDDVEIVLYTELAAPLAGITITPEMRLYVHTMFRPEIYWVQLPTD